jgi:pimeloyl-ACP methyl ester carboxylesterase
MQTIIENVAVFGQFGGLVGIFSEGVNGGSRGGEASVSELPAVIILNSGIVHRVGAGRLSTIWSRRLAGAGHCVLRFDLSGVGDSERRDDTLPPIEAAMADLRDAMDWLQSTRGIRRVILTGICTGADLSLLYAGTDPRVCGIMIIDPSTPPTLRHYVLKCMTYKPWKRKYDAVLNVLKWQRKATQAFSMDVSNYDSLPLNDPRVRACLADAYRSAFALSVKILAIFTAGADWYTYRTQLFDAFPELDFDGNLQLEYFKRCDHIITHEVNRAHLFEVVDSWLARVEFKSPVTAPDTSRLTETQSAAKSDDLISVEF